MSKTKHAPTAVNISYGEEVYVNEEKKSDTENEPMPMLKYEQHVMLDTVMDDVIFVHARGLGVERHFLHQLHLYSEPSFTVIVINTTPDDEIFFIEKLKQMNLNCPPKLLTADVTSKDRENIYAMGGIQFVTSRIFMVDLLMDRVPLAQTAGILVYRAHEILSTYQESFILRLYRERKKDGGFVKAFTDAPTSITAAGLGQLQRLVDRLYIRRVRVLPRFDELVKETFAEAAPSFVEIAVDLTAPQRRIRTCLIDIIATCVRELKQHTHGLELEVEAEAASPAAALRPTALEIDLKKKSLLISEKQERLLYDLFILRRLLQKVQRALDERERIAFKLTRLQIENLDPVTQHIEINELRENKEFRENHSGWMFSPTATKVFAGIEGQCQLKDEQQKPTISQPPKWRALESVLAEIKEAHAKTSAESAAADPPPVLVLASNESTCSQLIDLVKFGRAKLSWQQTKLYAEYAKRSFSVREPADEPMWVPEIVTSYDQQTLGDDKKKLIKTIKMSQRKEGRAQAKKGKTTTKRRKLKLDEPDAKQPKLVNFGIIRYAEKQASKGKRPPKVNVKEYIDRADDDQAANAAAAADDGGDDEDVQIIEQPLPPRASSAASSAHGDDEDLENAKSPIQIDDDEATNESAATTSGDGVGLVLPILMFTTLESRYNLIDCLESLRPRYLVLYHTDIATTRIIECFAASHPEHMIKLYALTYTNSTEEERYLTAVHAEQSALESLIREQGVLYMPTEYDTSRETASQLRSIALKSDSRRNRRDVPEEDEVQPKVVIDMREFMSELPTVVYKRGIDLQPVTLEVGDYVLSPTVAVERKALDDLSQSLTSGRAFKQIEQMLRHYPRTILLIESSEKFRKRRVNGGPFQGELSKRCRDTRSLLTMLIRANPKMTILWSLSPSHSAELFEELKLDEPNPSLNTALAIRSDDLGTDAESETSRRVNTVIRRQLQTLPTLTAVEIERAMRANCYETVADLIQTSAAALAAASGGGEQRASTLTNLFNCDFRFAKA